jgi:hypothetical protein
MPVERFSLTMDPHLGAAVRQAAERAGLSVSAWLSKAAAERVRNEALGFALERWEEEYGPITEEELDDAREEMGFPRKNPKKGS